mgnify:CR=1 FL=1
MASTYLSMAKSTPTNAKKFTVSVWVKKSGTSSSSGYYIIDSNGAASGSECPVAFDSNQKLRFGEYNSGDVFNFICNAVSRDPNGWMHVVVAGDSTQSTASNRVKIYINGELQSGTGSYPSQNHDFGLTKGSSSFNIGRWLSGTSRYFDGAMSHFHFMDGYVYDPTPFGETDSTTGEWKIKESVTGVTYGNNGFFILKDGNSVTDQSGNSNNFTVGGGTLTKTEDSPSNVFATMNPLSCSSYGSLTNGNTSVAGNNNADVAQFFSTLSTGKTGKYYIEAKVTSYTGTRPGFGIGNDDNPNIGKNVTGGTAMTGEGNFTSPSFNYRLDGAIRVNASTTATYSTFTTGDIISIAVDMDNGASYVAKNGTWQNSGNPASGASKTGAITTWTAGSISGFLINADIYYGASGTGNHADADFNFGNGYFGTTAVSSAGTNASGNGIFEYDVPNGYTALCTKGLNI